MPLIVKCDMCATELHPELLENYYNTVIEHDHYEIRVSITSCERQAYFCETCEKRILREWAKNIIKSGDEPD